MAKHSAVFLMLKAGEQKIIAKVYIRGIIEGGYFVSKYLVGRLTYVIIALLFFLGTIYSGLFTYLMVNGGMENVLSWQGWSAVLTFSTFLNLFVLIFILIQLFYQYKNKVKDDVSLTIVTLNNLYTQANYAYQEADRVLRHYPELPKKITAKEMSRVADSLKKCEQCICYLQQINTYEKQIADQGLPSVATQNYDLELKVCLHYLNLWKNVEFKEAKKKAEPAEQLNENQLLES